MFPALVEGGDVFLGGIDLGADVVEFVAIFEDGGIFHLPLKGVQRLLGFHDFPFHLLQLALLHVGELLGPIRFSGFR